MKIGLPGGERYWCEKCPDIPEEAVYLDNSKCRTIGCKKVAIWAPIGTRDNRLCGPCHKKLPEEEQKAYEDVMSKRCKTCEKARATFAKVPEGKTYAYVRPTHCGPCVRELPDANEYENVCAKRCETCEKTRAHFAKVPEGKTYAYVRPTYCRSCVENLSDADEYENVCAKRCEECVLLNEKTQANYAEDFTGYPARFCGRHAPAHFVHINSKPCPRCPRNNVINKNKPSGVCAYCDQNGYQKQYENAVLDRLKETYNVDDQHPVYVDGRSSPLHYIDGTIVSDTIVIAIEVDEPSHHHDKEADDRRMNICSEYLTKKHQKPVAWIRIDPYIYGGKKKHDGDQFGERATTERNRIVDKAVAKIDELIDEPESGVFYFCLKT
jgi:hypothetical protein